MGHSKGLFWCSIIHLLLGIVQFSSAQSIDYRFLHVEKDNELSHASIYAFEQDYMGFMWIGARDGLFKYDGKTSTIYRTNTQQPHTLSNNTIQTIYEDSQQRLWVGTLNGLNLYDRKLDVFSRISCSSDPKSPCDKIIHHLWEDKNGHLLVSTSSGLYRIKKNSATNMELITSSFTLSHNDRSKTTSDVNFVYEEHDGSIWIGAGDAVLALKGGIKNDGSFIINKIYQGERTTSLQDQHRTLGLLSISKDTLWIATKGGGILVLDKKTQKTTFIRHQKNNPNSLPSDDVRSLFKDSFGQIWVGTFKGLALKVGEKFHVFQSNPIHGLSDNSIRALFQDNRGSLWIGTHFGGVNLLDKDIAPFYNFTQNKGNAKLSINAVSALAEDPTNQTLYIGTEGAGINLLNRRKNDIQPASFLTSTSEENINTSNVKTIYLDRKENLWIGTYQMGLFVKMKGEQFFKQYTFDNTSEALAYNNVYSIIEDRQGKIWIGTYGGGLQEAIIEKNAIRFRKELVGDGEYSSNWLRFIFEDSQSNLWVGTDQGLFCKKSNKNQFIIYNSKNQNISENDVTCMHEDVKGNLWLGTHNNGFHQYDRAKDFFQQVSSNSALASYSIFSILSDNNQQLWLGTDRGIICYNTQNYTYRIFNQQDGAVGSVFLRRSALKLADGNLAFGSFSGLSIFNPDSLRTNPFRPALAFTALKVFNQTISPSADGLIQAHISTLDQIEINHDQNAFSLEFAALNYVHPERNQYAYKLEGFDKKWTYTSIPIATYTNLDPGKYELHIMGSNNDGLWNGTPKILTIIIRPAPWLTMWAYLLYVLAFGVIGFYVYHIIKERSRIKNQLAVDKLIHEREKNIHKEKIFFFSGVSHEIRTPLTMIVAPLEKLKEDKSLPAHALELINLSSKHAERLMSLVNELLLFQKIENSNTALHLEHVNLVSFVFDLHRNFYDLAVGKRISFNLINEVNGSLELLLDVDKFHKILSNLLSNAIKYTDPNGLVSLRVHASDIDSNQQHLITLEVSDSGKGITDIETEKVFDIFYQAGSSKQIDGGFGIGLSLVKSLVEILDGNITVQSNLAKKTGDINTIFTVKLPVAASNQHLIPQESDTESLSTIRQAIKDSDKEIEQDEKPIVLVVEDDNELRRFIRLCLEQNYDIVEAENGTIALTLLESLIPNIIISDFMMPQMDGLELLSAVKSNKNLQHIPFLVLTAKASHTFEMETLAEGADDYITKPFSPKLLLLKIENLLIARQNLLKKFVQEHLVRSQKEHVPIETDFLGTIIRIIDEHIANESFSVQDLAKHAGISRTILYEDIKRQSGLNVIEFINMVRLKKAAQILSSDPQYNVSNVAYEVGFADPKYFSKLFKKMFKTSPTEYRKQHLKE